jgi:hypothetical protein
MKLLVASLAVEIAMNRPVIQPSKEQVRAYMAAREHARQPPPPPEDIRRQLGWKLAPSETTCALINLCLLPAALGQIAAQAAFQLCLLPLRQSPLRQAVRTQLGSRGRSKLNPG